MTSYFFNLLLPALLWTIDALESLIFCGLLFITIHLHFCLPFHLISIIYLQFLETGPELGSHYNEVIAPQDVATYGGLCALASFDRSELKANIYCIPSELFLKSFMV